MKSNNPINIFPKLDCDVIEILENHENYLGWSSCLSLKNGSNECGEVINVGRDEKSMWTPLRAYWMIEAMKDARMRMKEPWVENFIHELIFS